MSSVLPVTVIGEFPFESSSNILSVNQNEVNSW